MSRSSDVDACLLRKKRLKVIPAASSCQDENERPKQCYCFEKSECVVSELRAARRKEFPNVRRKLDFGPEEDSVQESSSLLFHDQDDRSKRLWNFDFLEEVPLPGQWVWVKHERTAEKKPVEALEPAIPAAKQKSLKDLFPVSKSNRSRKRSLDSSFRVPLTRMRSTETSPA